MSRISILLILLIIYLPSKSQKGEASYMEGYALRGKDSIYCKILFDVKHPHAMNSIKLLIQGQEAVFHAGGLITGFCVYDDTVKYEFGTVNVSIQAESNNITNQLFLKKLISGTVELYEHEYRIGKRVTSRGARTITNTTDTYKDYTDYYIAKNDLLVPQLSTPVLLTSFRKKDLTPYIKDNSILLASFEKNLNLKELLALLNEYNNAMSSGKAKLSND